ncbi:MAG TPA: hypothetical protein VGN12_22715 [Pirellulales bacterium]|jgi:hypothetical protein
MPFGLDMRAINRVSGPAWKAIKPHFDVVNAALLGVSPTSQGELTRIYIKYTTAETGSQPFAVMWVRSSSELVIGLALPPDFPVGQIRAPLRPIAYSGLTTYFCLSAVDSLPAGIETWSAAAYANCLSACESLRAESVLNQPVAAD